MARYPGARWRPVARYQPGGHACQAMSRYDAGVDHTYVGSPSPDAAFAHFNVDGTPIPHFMVFRDGSIDQYVDTRFRSSACLDGNPRVIAWETADGYPTLWTAGHSQAPKDTPAMVAAKAKLMVWLHKEHGIPLTRMPSSRPTARGFGWHRLGIDGNYEQKPGELLGGRVAGGERWSPSFGKTCPTSVRIHQFVDETIPAAVKLAKPPAPTGTVRVPHSHIAHPKPGRPEYEGDSNRMIDHAAKVGLKWWDGNVLLDKAGTPLNAHYPFPLRHGFIDPEGKLHRDTPLSEMTPEEWGRLETEKGDPPYVVRTMAQRIDHARVRGINTEADLKCLLTVTQCKTLLRGNHVWFKTMATLIDESDPRIETPWERLHRAKKAGGTTILICPRPLMRVPKEYEDDIDYFRRFKPRFM